MTKYYRGNNAPGRGALGLLVLASLWAAGLASAAGPVVTQGTCQVSWDAPLTNTDGTPLLDLAKYRVYVGTAPGVKKGGPPTAEVLAPSPAPTPGTKATWVCVGLTPGQKYAVVTAVDLTDLESAESNEVPFVFGDLANAPTNLRMGPP